ncbi:MAG: type VI secretion system contractile sheath small subunit, partial [Candidatus Competibacteraceae bacterium]
MPSRLEFQFTLPRVSTTPVRRDPDAPLHLLIMADFSGRGHREAPAALLDLTQRPLMTVDADNFNAVMARLTPRLRLPLDAERGTVLTLGFSQLDDFHPDALYQRLELFQVLRRTRARLLNPASFAQAVTELNATAVPVLESASPAPTATSESESDLLERLLGRAPAAAAPPRPTDPGATAIQTLLQAVVQPHIVHSDPSQPAWIAAVDAAT